MRLLTLEELHDVLLGTAKEFHKICEKNGIPYYMVGGTMLGAVRHKGFIPWDDDMDFGVPREYYKSLIDLLQKELPSQYKLLTIDNSDTLLKGFIKIEDTRTVMKELWKENVSTFNGVNIDIFPIDKCNGKKGKWSKNFMIQILLNIQSYRFLSSKNRPFSKKILAYILKTVLCFLDKRTIIKFIEKHLINDGTYYTNHYGAYGFKEIMPFVCFGKCTLYCFEDTQFYGVQDSDKYLKNLYGDYMQLPPEDKRHIHILNMYWK